ncbi:replicative DNA helicase [Candidatus Parcubacteria bacterium]|nr:MAG: replicative DNA helicase [Candidatus Parcubacteria bacterium]
MSESKNILGKMPPQNLDAEKSVLGALMLEPKTIDVVVDILRPDDFYHTKHQIIYQAIVDLYQKKEPIDVLSLSNRLKEKKQMDTIGASYLTELVNTVPTAGNAKHYAEIVHKKSILRDLIESSGHISQLGYNEEEEIDSILDEAEKKIFSIARMSTKQKFVSMKTSMMDAWERFDKLHKSKGELRGTPTGFSELDNLLAGFQKSDLIILAARPSMGKSALALDIARNVACKYSIPVGIFSLEMSTQSLVDRMIASEAHVDSWKLRTGKLSSEDEFTRIRDALDRLSTAPIFIDDESSVNIMQMRAKARRLQAEHGLGLIVVDYLQLMVPRQKSDNMVQQITEISRSLKGLAKDLDVPVLALSQLARAVELRNPPIPKLHDLRDSGSIEQDADVVMFIYREDKYKPETDRKNIAEIHVEKHRNGPTGKIDLYFNPEKVSFSAIERGEFGSF